MTRNELKERMVALARNPKARDAMLIVSFTDGARDLFDAEAVELHGDVLTAMDHLNRKVAIPYEHIADISLDTP